MKQTLSTGQAAMLLKQDEYGGWSYAGAHALVEYLESYEEDTGEEIELDVVAIRCDYSEYESASKAAKEYGWEPCDVATENANDTNALVWLEERTSVIVFDGGVIVQGF